MPNNHLLEPMDIELFDNQNELSGKYIDSIHPQKATLALIPGDRRVAALIIHAYYQREPFVFKFDRRDLIELIHDLGATLAPTTADKTLDTLERVAELLERENT